MSDSIRRAVAAAMADRLGREAQVTGWRGPHQADWSWLFSFEAGGDSGGGFIAKVPRWEDVSSPDAVVAAGEQASTAAEYACLEEIASAVRASGDPGLIAVEPVTFVASANTIVMRRLEAKSLRSRLRVLGTRGDVAALFARLGRWIALFHAMNGIERVAWDAGTERAGVEAMAKSLERRRVMPVSVREALLRLEAWAGRLEGSEQPITRIHGDLNLSNVLVTRDDRIAVIDPNRRRGSALIDPARSITDAWLEKRRLTTGWLPLGRGHRLEWEERLLAAAGYAGEPTLEYRLARQALERWVELEAEVRGAARIGLAAVRPQLRSEVERRLDVAG